MSALLGLAPTDAMGAPPAVARAQQASLDPAVAKALEATRVDLAAYRSMVATTADLSTLTAAVDRALLANSADAQLRQLRATSQQIRGPLSAVDIIVDSTIRVTDNQAPIPLSLDNKTDAQLRVTLSLRSERVQVDDFVDGETTTLWLQPGVNTYTFDAQARGTGRYTVDVALHSPDGSLKLAEAAITVAPTAPSPIAIVLLLAALVVLAIWWLRDRARKSRELAMAS